MTPHAVRKLLTRHGIDVAALAPLPGGHTGNSFRAETSLGPLVVKVRTDPRPVMAARAAARLLAARRLPHADFVAPPIPTPGGWLIAQRWIPGAALADTSLSSWDTARAAELGADIGRWLRAMHAIKAGAGRWPARAGARYRDKLGRCREVGLLDGPTARQVSRFWDQARPALGWVRPALVHRDLQAGNIIVRDRRFAAVVDFEQARVADPLYDFVKLKDWVFPLRPEIGPALCAAYGLRPREQGIRPRLEVVFLLEYLSALVYFHKHRNASLVEVTRQRLQTLLERSVSLP